MTEWPLRSMLFIPAHKLEWIRSVSRFVPDSVVLDLEDALPLALKEQGRGMVREGIEILRRLGILAFVRINALDAGGEMDISEIVVEGLTGIMLPKAGSAEEVRRLDALLSYGEGRAGLPLGSVFILPLPETAKGLLHAYDLAAASPRVKGLITVVGGPVAGDVARAVGIKPTLDGDEQLYLNSKIVLESRAAGAIYPMASIIGTKLDDLDAVKKLVTRAKQFGFAGAILIHPNHVAVANAVYTPSVDEVRYFSGMLAAMRDGERRGESAVRYEGLMIDYAMMPEAEEIVREGKRRGVSCL